MTVVLTTLGIVAFVVALVLSVAWHELGHMAAAKMFGIRCTQFFVGFGKTLWSRTWGETEYGIKAFPLGGFVRMVGMIPPSRHDPEASGKPMSRWRAMIEDAREAARVDLEPGDKDRQFYQRAPWKRLIVMFAGPVMNLVLAIVIFAVVMMGFGFFENTTTVGRVNECVVAAGEDVDGCPDGAPPTPALEAGIQEGDRILSVDGQETPDWSTLQSTIRESGGTTTVVLERDGETHTVRADVIESEVESLDENGEAIVRTDADGEPIVDEQGRFIPETEPAGFLGFTPLRERQPLTAGETVVEIGTISKDVAVHLVALPTKIPGLWDAAFLGGEREADSPVGVVGASRLGGEIVAMEIPVVDRTVTMLMLLATVNFFLFAFNMLPILPLDGGHILGAIWESIRRWWARIFTRPDPGPFDVAKLMPVAYVVVVCFIGFSVLLLVADVVNPVRIIQ